MRDSAHPRRASDRFAALLGRPAPEPLTAEQEADYRRWMFEGDAALSALIARRTSLARTHAA